MLLLYLALTVILQVIAYFLVAFVIVVIFLKLWLEPVKGVCKCKTRLDGKTVLVTGGNSGIGYETALGLAKRGARVIIASRNTKKSKEAVENIIEATGNVNVVYRHLDLSDFSSVREFADDINKTVERLDILVNNAGLINFRQYTTRDGNENVIQVNYLGGFLLTNLLIDKLKASKPSRIVVVSSYGYICGLVLGTLNIDKLSGTQPMGYWRRYCNSKLCQILWTKALSKRLPDGVTVNALHPGVVKTDIFEKVNPALKFVMLSVIDMLFKTPEEGARTTLHLCLAPELEKVTGEYFSDCKVNRVWGLSSRKQVVEKLWEESMRLTAQK